MERACASPCHSQGCIKGDPTLLPSSPGGIRASERDEVSSLAERPIMTAPQFPFSVHGNGSPNQYEHLKEEHDLPVVNSAGMTITDSGSSVIQINSEPPPRDHVVCSIFTTMYCNFCCLGLMALAFSFKARDRKMLGDHSGARSYGSTARCLNILAVLLSISLAVITIIIAVSLTWQLHNQ